MSIAEFSPQNSSPPHDEEPAVLASRDGDEEMALENGMTRDQAWNLYTSHFLSTWNVRGYEFAAVSVCLLVRI